MYKGREVRNSMAHQSISDSFIDHGGGMVEVQAGP